MKSPVVCVERKFSQPRRGVIWASESEQELGERRKGQLAPAVCVKTKQQQEGLAFCSGDINTLSLAGEECEIVFTERAEPTSAKGLATLEISVF